MKMDKPVFTEKQAKGTIRGKKCKKETLKNVLVNPYVRRHWPLIKGKDEIFIREILQKNLPTVRAVKTSVPWREIKDVPAEQRKEFRMKYANTKSQRPPDELIRASLAFGVNEVTKLLERDDAGSVLVAGDVAPQLMVKHVVDLAVLHKTPILIVPELRDLLKRHAGIGSAAIALPKHLKEDTGLFRINKIVKIIYKNYPAPSDHVNINCGSAEFFDESPVENVSDHDGVQSKEKGRTQSELPQEIVDCYLYRKSTSERVFVPSEATKCAVKSHPTEYIKLGNDVTGVIGKCGYKPLIVNRIKGNKNRSQRKIALLKQSKK